MFTNKFNEAISFQNLNFLFTLAFAKQLFTFQTFPTPPTFCDLSPFLKYHRILKNVLHLSTYILGTFIPTVTMVGDYVA